jgi:hypothetical protein
MEDTNAAPVAMQLTGLAAMALCMYMIILNLSQVFPRVYIFSPGYMGGYAWRHRLVGLVYLVALTTAALDLVWPLGLASRAQIHVLLPVLGTVLALTAASDFKEAHRRVVNVASGALDQDQTVSYSEMLEHSFYQGVNVFQALYVHGLLPPMLGSSSSGPSGSLVAGGGVMWHRAVAFLLASSPWIVRPLFPINSFSANYSNSNSTSISTGTKKKLDDHVMRDPASVTSIMYRVKKWQYVFYKHALLHGLNASLVLYGGTRTVVGVDAEAWSDLGSQPSFAVYWTGLNAAYVLEFFLQSLVKRGHLSQTCMLVWNQALMAVTTVAAVQVLVQHVLWAAALVSVGLNFGNRGSEVVNILLLLVFVVMWRVVGVDHWWGGIVDFHIDHYT